ncbi:MAG: DNA-processing protein DprA [Oscillospiraceae bacterium]|nr:DNA-processing protein DprA [Oscillospiraceae bacterium]
MELQTKPETPEEMLRYWVWLSLVFGAGSTALLRYLQRADSPQDVYEAMQAGMLRDLPPNLQKAMTEHSLSEAESIVYYCRKNNVALLTIDSEAYPQMLRNIAAPPVLLTAKGNLSLLHNPLSVAMVGTRRPSPYTERVTAWIASELGARGFTIVSGCAKGVDTVAHTNALDGGGSTVAVLGCGINVNYPRENQALRERMISGGEGLLISEYLPGTQPFPANFPKRNRILSGLANATAVTEAAARSGSLVTAQCANDQGRHLFCVPPADIFDTRYAGVIPMLRDGAYPLMSYEDILMVYYSRYPQYMDLQKAALRNSERLVFSGEQTAETAAPEQPEIASKEAAVSGKSSIPATVPEAPAPSGTDAALPEDPDARRIVEFLRQSGECYADDIAAALDMDLSQLLSILTLLELDGYAESLFGKQYRAC